MDLAYYYELWRGMMLSADPAVADAVAWWQEFYVKFYMAFIEADRWKQYLDGIGTTLTATALALVLGVVLGILVALVRTAHDQQRADRRRNPVLGLFNGVCKVYVTVIRGTPMMAQAMFIYYGLMPLLGINSTITQAAYFILSINTGAYMAETVRGGILSIDPGQTEGAKSIGMTHVQTMIYVILPQALRNLMPQIGNNLIINIKDTSVMFVIGFVEFFATHRNIVGNNLLYFPSAIIEMAGYLILTLAASFLLRWLEKRLDGSDNYELVSTDSLAMSAGTYSHPSRKTPFDERSGEFGSGRPKGEY